MVTTGDPEANRKLVAEHGIQCPILLQEKMEVASLYQAHGTPMGYLIDAQGLIASPLTTGAQALLTLANAATQTKHHAAQSANGHKVHKGNRSLSPRVGSIGVA